MEILFTRHGQTEWNVLGKVQGRVDIPLNATGAEQAETIRCSLAYTPFDIILTSPLKRATETARIIRGSRDIEIKTIPELIERDFGEFEGLASSQFDFNAFWSYRQNLQYKKAENIQDFFERIFNILSHIREQYKGRKVLIVSHGGVSIPVKCFFDGIPDLDTLVNLGVKNCEVTKFSYDNRYYYTDNEEFSI